MITFATVFVLLVVCSALFSGAETAFFSLSRLELRRLRDDSGSGAQRVVRLLRKPRDLLIGTLLGNELTNNALAVMTAAFLSQSTRSPWLDIVLTIVCVTPIVLVFGEMLPKNFAVLFAPTLSRGLAVPMHAFQWLTAPVRGVLTMFADFGVRCCGGDPGQVRSMIVEEEFQQLVDLGSEAGELSEAERQLIHGVFALADRTVEDVMTPASAVFRIPLTWPSDQIVEELRAAQFSRVPVYRDDPYAIIGLLYIRDLAPLLRRPTIAQDVDITELVRPILKVPADTRVDAMLKEFQRTKIHLAVVKSADGRALGIVTMDDLLDMLLQGEHE